MTPDAYVEDVERAAAAFVESKVLFDRSDTVSTLRSMMGAKEGHFVHFLGGLDTGKSLLLSHLAATLPAKGRRVLLNDARASGANINRGIVDAIKADRPFANRLVADVPSLSRYFAWDVISNPALQPSLELLSDLLEAFLSTCKSSGSFPVLIIDEANRALPSTTGEARAHSLQALNLLTRLTKQQGRLNVLLTTTEHSEPVRLAELGYHTCHMTGTVVACEVPPAEMRRLLVEQWHCGPALAEGLISVYGGLVWRTNPALGKLAREKAGFRACVAFAPESDSGVAACIKAARSGEPKWAGLEAMLRELAVRGYVAISDPADPRAELMSRLNVGDVVPRSASAPGLPPEAWDASSFVLAVSSQCLRLLLAGALTQAPIDYKVPRSR